VSVIQLIGPRPGGSLDGGENEYTFTGTLPSTLTLPFQAKVTPSTAANDWLDRVSFSAPDIGTITAQLGAKSADTQTGLITQSAVYDDGANHYTPSQNSAFGTKTVSMAVTTGHTTEATIEVFWPFYDGTGPEDGDHWARTATPAVPNWFHYYTQEFNGNTMTGAINPQWSDIGLQHGDRRPYIQAGLFPWYYYMNRDQFPGLEETAYNNRSAPRITPWAHPGGTGRNECP
jgi:hypothetical protein